MAAAPFQAKSGRPVHLQSRAAPETIHSLFNAVGLCHGPIN
jgi:hypothetical protein